MMKRFGDSDFFGDEDQPYDYDEEYTDHGPMMGGPIPAELIQQWKQSEINLEGQKINFIVLQQTVRVLEKSWSWRFRSTASRIKSISSVYYAFSDLVLCDD